MPVFTTLPRYQPSPKPSSNSTSSILSPRRKVSSSGPLALKSSTSQGGQLRASGVATTPVKSMIKTHGWQRENRRDEDRPQALAEPFPTLAELLGVKLESEDNSNEARGRSQRSRRAWEGHEARPSREKKRIGRVATGFGIDDRNVEERKCHGSGFRDQLECECALGLG